MPAPVCTLSTDYQLFKLPVGQEKLPAAERIFTRLTEAELAVIFEQYAKGSQGTVDRSELEASREKAWKDVDTERDKRVAAEEALAHSQDTVMKCWKKIDSLREDMFRLEKVPETTNFLQLRQEIDELQVKLCTASRLEVKLRESRDVLQSALQRIREIAYAPQGASVAAIIEWVKGSFEMERNSVAAWKAKCEQFQAQLAQAQLAPPQVSACTGITVLTRIARAIDCPTDGESLERLDECVIKTIESLRGDLAQRNDQVENQTIILRELRAELELDNTQVHQLITDKRILQDWLQEIAKSTAAPETVRLYDLPNWVQCRIEGDRRTFDKLHKELEQARERTVDLEKNLRISSEQRKQAEDNSIALSQKVGELEKDLGQAKEALNGAKEAADNTANLVLGLRQQVQELKEINARLEGQLAPAAPSVATHEQSTVAELTRSLKAADQRVADMKAAIVITNEAIEKKVAYWTNNCRDLQEKANSLMVERNEARKQLSDTQVCYEADKAEVRQAAKLLAAKHKLCVDLQEELSTTIRSHGTLSAEHEAWRQPLLHIQHAWDTANDSIRFEQQNKAVFAFSNIPPYLRPSATGDEPKASQHDHPGNRMLEHGGRETECWCKVCDAPTGNQLHTWEECALYLKQKVKAWKPAMLHLHAALQTDKDNERYKAQNEAMISFAGIPANLRPETT